MVVIALGCVGLGLGLGYTIGRSGARGGGDAASTANKDARTSGEARARVRESGGVGPSGSSRLRPAQLRGLIEGSEEHEPEGEEEPRRRATGSVSSPRTAGEFVEGGEPGAGRTKPKASELEELREALQTLQQEQQELLGEPIAAPPNVGARFGGPTVSRSVHDAIAQVGVPGGVESVDCEEHPCIVFGRLAGDEEDMEEIERSAALSEYQSDVLTLLFWATTATPEEVTRAPETGLFALSFYSFEDQAEFGEALERRIRARVMEYWNSDRPGGGSGDDKASP